MTQPVGRSLGQTHATGYDDATRERLVTGARAIMARYPRQRSALLPILHLVQSEDGYVSPRGITFAAETLGLTTAEVSAVATFYTQFKRHPNGTYTVGVCTTALCAIMGGDAIWDELVEHLGIGNDETTEDGAITLERVECNAACDYAPVVMVNWEFFDNQTPASAVHLTDDLRAGWLDAIGSAIAHEIDRGRSVVATCSALKRAYRDRLRGFSPDIVFLYLKIDPVTARARVASRRDHFMPASLVESQFAILEEPAPAEQAETLDATLAVDKLEETARKRLSQP